MTIHIKRPPNILMVLCAAALGVAIFVFATRVYATASEAKPVAKPDAKPDSKTDVTIPGGEIRKADPKAKNATIKTFGPVTLSPIKAALKKSGPIRAYLEGVTLEDEAVEIQAFLHAGRDVDYHNYLGSIGNVFSGHSHGEALTLTFEVKDFKVTNDKGNVLSEGKTRSTLANADQVSLTLICKKGGMTFKQLRITDQIEE